MQPAFRWTPAPVLSGDAADDEARFWRPKEWPGLELMRARWVRHSFRKHAHDCYTIGVNAAGCGIFDCRGEQHAAAPGMLNLIAPGEAHTGRAGAVGLWVYLDFYIDVELMNSFTEQADVVRSPRFRSASVWDPDLARRLLRSFSSMAERSSARLERESLLISALRRLISRHALACRSEESTQRCEPKATTRIRDYLRAHYAEEIPVAALAALVGRSPYSLIRAFQRETGLPPHCYQNTLRVGAAQKLIRQGAPLVEVAAACGFCDQSHMNRVFQRTLGSTPGRYRGNPPDDPG